jgi:HNH endonuclease
MKSHDFDVSDVFTELDKWVEVDCPCGRTPSDNHETPNFDVWYEVDEAQYHAFLQQMTEEVFFVLFGNRTFLHKFHSHLAELVRNSDAETWLPGNDLFRMTSNNGSILKRANIPEWAKRAVFFRDRGHCCNCERDLSGAYSPINRAEYDHIVPLATGGLNDVTNLQLLCKECNNSKRATRVEPGRTYERWYPMEREAEHRFVPNLTSVVASLEFRQHQTVASPSED